MLPPFIHSIGDVTSWSDGVTSTGGWHTFGFPRVQDFLGLVPLGLRPAYGVGLELEKPGHDPDYQAGWCAVNQFTMKHDLWPDLPYAAWKDTYATLHLWTQIVSKIRLAQTPSVNHSWLR
jgi:hypothetical protein